MSFNEYDMPNIVHLTREETEIPKEFTFRTHFV